MMQYSNITQRVDDPSLNASYGYKMKIKPALEHKTTYAYVNCKVYAIENQAPKEIAITNKTHTLCFQNQIFQDKFAFLHPARSNDKAVYLLDINAGQIDKLENSDNGFIYHDLNPFDGTTYSYKVGEDVYTGSKQNLFEKKLYDPDKQQIMSKLGIPDDLGIKLSPNYDRLLIQDSLSTPNQDVVLSTQIINKKGDLLFGVDGLFGKWVDNKHVVYIDKSTLYLADVQSLKIVEVAKISGKVMKLSVFADLVLVSTVNPNAGQPLSTTTYIYSASTGELLYSDERFFLAELLLDQNNFVALDLVHCEGYYEEDKHLPFPCPIDNPYDYYIKGLILVGIKDKKLSNLISFDQPTIVGARH